MGLYVGLKNNLGRDSLKTIAAQNDGSRWIEDVLRQTALSHNTAPLARLDHALFSVSSGVVPILVAAALLFDDADECLQQFRHGHRKRQIQSKTKFNHGMFTGNTFIRVNGDYSAFARAVGLKKPNAKRFLRFNGLPNFGPMAASESEFKALRAFGSGSPIAESCSRFGVDPVRFERILRIASTPALRAAAQIEKRRRIATIKPARRAQ
jgi:hypothetical protein